MKAAIYVRISKDSENQGLGVARQEKDCRALARQEGWTVAEVYRDNDLAASRRDSKRPAYEQLWKDVEEGIIQAVLAYHPKRLYRRLDQLEKLVDLVETHGNIPIKTVAGGEIDLTTSQGRAIARITATLAQLETEELSERIGRKQQELADKGLWQGGPRPFGYEPVSAPGGTSLAIVPEEADAIRDAAGRILSGEGLRTVARRWNDSGLRTPSRKRDGKGSRKPGGNKWTPKALKTVLMSPRIVGLREHRGELTKATWPGILDKRTWNRVRDEFARRAESATRKGLPVSRKYLLTGFLRCATCGGSLIGHPRGKVRAYACISTSEHPKGGRPRINAERLEALLLELAAERTVRRTKVRNPSLVAAGLREELDEIEDKVRLWARESAVAGLPAELIRVGHEPLAKRRDEIEAEIAKLSAIVYRSEGGRHFADLAATARKRFGSSPAESDPRADLESKLDYVVVRPVARNKWIGPSGRIEVVWRDSASSVA